jgi:glycosyltransferase involved in cell wall biosynthesis
MPAGLDAEAFRTQLAPRIAGGSAAAEKFRLLIAAEHRISAEKADRLALAASGSGIIPKRLGQATHEIDGSSMDGLLLLDPVDPGSAYAAVRMGWLGAHAEPWLARSWFDDLDIVLVADDATAARVERESAKVATVIPDPTGEDGIRAMRQAIARWVETRRVAIHIGAVTWDAAAGWGDLPFARGVQRAFEHRGWSATVHPYSERDDPRAMRADAAIHLFGARAPSVRHGQPTLLWVISHPDHVTRDLLTAYDHVAVASAPFLEEIRAWLGSAAPRLISLNQATDPDRFFPEPGGPKHELLFVGSSRGLRRPIVDALSETDHDVAVYGRGWTADLLDQRHLRGEWIPNESLRRFYAAADIVLSDTYSDMRDEGFIPNRIYDALASGAFVISEDMAGLAEEFDDAVVAFRDAAELPGRIDEYLARPEERRAKAEIGRRAVLARHTFADRVSSIIDVLAPNGTASEPDR